MTVKTAISVDDTLFARVESTAKELHVSRSQLFAMAMEDFLKRYDSQRLLEAINAAYSDSPDAEEEAVMRAMRRHREQMAEGQW
jgi:metal-responsive CopG/Arc/MetJ family transcriptional regulator